MTVFAARKIAIVMIWGLVATPAQPQRFSGDMQFRRYPFDKWAAENAKPQIRWTVRIDPPHLSPHQRLLTQFHLTLDADELRRHQSGGPIVLFVRVEDSAGRRYQTGGQRPIAALHRGDQFLQLDYDLSAFILPGDYAVSFAVCDGRTLEHSFVRRSLHVAGVNSDPLPGAWNGLPPVEFLPSNGIPDAWYLPQVRSRIRLPVETQRPVRLELLVNTTQSELGSVNSFRRNMELIVPSLKVLMGIEPANGSTGLTIVDLNRRAVSYEHPGPGALDWSELRRAFAEVSAATVDEKTLAGQRKMLDYFAAEAARRLGPADENDNLAHVLIVLSAPVYFTQQEKPPPPDLPADPRRSVFYISYSPMAILVAPTSEPAFRSTVQRPLYLFTDDIERLLRPMGARVFRVTKPEEFRKALGTILDEVTRTRDRDTQR
jgi:hypothetical protein